VKATTRHKLPRRKRTIEQRLARRHWTNQLRPMLSAPNLHYELAKRGQAVACGGLGAVHLLANGTCIEHLELLRSNAAALDALDAEPLSDPATAGDFCRRGYRMIVLRKRIPVEKGQEELFEEYRSCFYRSNARISTAEEMVLSANDRCDQENRIEQLKNGVRTMRNPLDHRPSNWSARLPCRFLPPPAASNAATTSTSATARLTCSCSSNPCGDGER